MIRTGMLDGEAPWRTRGTVFAIVLALHVAAIVGLLRAFAPHLVAPLSGGALHAVTVPLPPPTPKASPKPTPPSPAPQTASRPPPSASSSARTAALSPPGPAGKAAPRAPRAEPSAAISLGQRVTAASAAGGGGAGTGAGAGTSGSGAGTGGEGSGGSGAGAAAARPVKIAGEISSARDFPRESRDLRINSRVVILLVVGTDGRPRDCRVREASADPVAGTITCRLALERFRFRPALGADGQPIESVYGWQQRWFY